QWSDLAADPCSIDHNPYIAAPSALARQFIEILRQPSTTGCSVKFLASRLQRFARQFYIGESGTNQLPRFHEPKIESLRELCRQRRLSGGHRTGKHDDQPTHLARSAVLVEQRTFLARAALPARQVVHQYRDTTMNQRVPYNLFDNLPAPTSLTGS